MLQLFDVVVIGAGPGGYVAAIRAAQLGFNTACIDATTNANNLPSLGGTCLNVGCIPSKALLESSENFERLQHEFADHGITVKDARIDLETLLKRKTAIVDKLTSGVALLFKKNKVTSFHGVGSLVQREGEYWKIAISRDQQSKTYIMARHVIIATGSLPRMLTKAPVDNKMILDNEGALAMTAVPKRLAVIGAGVIGLEMGSVWKRLGSEVTLLEAHPQFLNTADEAIAKEAHKFLTQKLGLVIENGIQIDDINADAQQINITYSNLQGQPRTLTVDKLIVAIGRVPNTQNLGADNVGLKCNAAGFIEVDTMCRTNLANIWAIGDVVRGPMLAHKASEEGVAVAEYIAGQQPHIDLDIMPWVIYTSPEIAWIGKTEQHLKAEGVAYKKGQFPFAINGRALALGKATGFVKMLSCKNTDRILGIHIIGPFASELIAEAVIAMAFNASSEDIARIVHAHPSLAEGLHEAALSCDKRSLNS